MHHENAKKNLWNIVGKINASTPCTKLSTTTHQPSKIPHYCKTQQEKYCTRHYHPDKFHLPIAKTDTYKNSFFPRTIADCNSLPADIIDIANHDSFKRALEHFNREEILLWNFVNIVNFSCVAWCLLRLK